MFFSLDCSTDPEQRPAPVRTESHEAAAMRTEVDHRAVVEPAAQSVSQQSVLATISNHGQYNW